MLQDCDSRGEKREFFNTRSQTTRKRKGRRLTDRNSTGKEISKAALYPGGKGGRGATARSIRILKGEKGNRKVNSSFTPSSKQGEKEKENVRAT